MQGHQVQLIQVIDDGTLPVKEGWDKRNREKEQDLASASQIRATGLEAGCSS